MGRRSMWGTACLVLAVTAGAQTPAQRKHQHPAGLTLTLPEGWSANDGSAGIILLPPGVTFNPAEGKELYLAAAHSGYKGLDDPKLIADLQQEFAKPELGAGERKPFTASGGRPGLALSWNVTEPSSGEPMAIRLYLTSGGGNVLVVLGVGLRPNVAKWEAHLQRVAAGIDFNTRLAKEAEGSLSDSSALAKSWIERLRGKKLTFLRTSQYETAKKVMILAADGTFTLAGNSLASISVGPYAEAPAATASAIGRQGAEGRWRIVSRGNQAFLVLKASDGSQAEYELTLRGTATHLDGVRWFVTDPDE